MVSHGYKLHEMIGNHLFEVILAPYVFQMINSIHLKYDSQCVKHFAIQYVYVLLHNI